MNRLAFLKTLYNAVPPEMYTYIWQRNEIEKKAGATRSFRISELEAMDRAVDVMNLFPFGTSFSPGLLDHSIDKHAADSDIVALSNLWTDIDIKSAVHYEENLYTSAENVIETMENTLKPVGLYPNIIVSSGYGIHIYWIFSELLYTRTSEERAIAKGLLTKIQSVIRKISEPYTIDKTDNLGRTLRLPETRNWKNGVTNAPESRVIYHDSLFYSVNEIKQRIEEFHKRNTPEVGEPSGISEKQLAAVERMRSVPVYDKPALKLNISGDSELLFKHCSYFRMISTRMNSINYQTLLAAIPILLTDSENGERIANELCKVKFGEKYDERRSWHEIESIKRKLKPTTCKKLREIAPNLDCSSCPVHTKARSSPCALIQSQTVRDEVESAPNSVGELIDDAPKSIRNLIFPRGYKINVNGLIELSTSKILMDTPVIISEKIRTFDDNEVKYRIQYQNEVGTWLNREIQMNDLVNARNVTETLANIGISTHSSVSKQSAEFFFNYLTSNKGVIKEKVRYNRTGWLNGRFLIPTTLHENEEFPTGEFFKTITGKGDLLKSKTLIYEGLQYAAVRVAIAAGLASPLLSIVGYRNFIVDIFGQTATGKTAALTLANSMIGSPESIIKLNTTVNAFELELMQRNDLTTFSNEWQLISSDPKFRERFANGLIYKQESGTTKRRLNKNAETKPIHEWKSILVVTAEESIIRDNALGGEITRTLEFEFLPFIGKMVEGKPEVDEKFISRIYSETQENYGRIFPIYVKGISDLNKEELISEWNEITEDLLRETENTIQTDHAKMLAILMLAYRKFLCLIYEFSEEESKIATNSDFKPLLEQIPRKEGSSDSNRAKQAIIDWFIVHELYFVRQIPDETKAAREIYGYIDFEDNQPMIVPGMLTKALKEAGFSPSKILLEWRRSGEITYDGRQYSKVFTCRDGERRRLTKLSFLRYNSNQEKPDANEMPFD